VKFTDLGLEESLERAVVDLGFEEPTVIQEKAIPQLLQEKKDLVGLAQTGTGKTAAFGLPLLQLVDNKERKIQALVLSPTRELCVQISKDLEVFSKYKKTSTVAVYGGANIERQISSIKRGAQVIVATPGRLTDLIRRRAIDLSNVEIVVLDEADEMLNMGFKDELDTILSETPDSKSTWLFSATMLAEVRRIASSYMTDPIEIKAGKSNSTNKNIDHQYLVVSQRHRGEALKRVLDNEPDIFAVVFCRTKRDTQEVADSLSEDGYNSDALHGDLSQAQRDRVMKKFRDRSLSILVATDVAARGIDVNDVTHVIHHKLPEDVENYTHRSGRTARAGKKGTSIALVIKKDLYKIKQLEKITGASFTKIEAPTAQQICEKKLLNYSKELTAQKVSESVQDYLESFSEQLKDLSKEELIQKLASREMESLLAYYGNKKDLSAEEERGRNSSNSDRFFINIGEKDELDRAEMKDFLSDVMGLEKQNILAMDLKDSYSFFEYPKGNVEVVLALSDQFDCNGRTVRIELTQSRPRKDRKRKFSGRRDGNYSGGGRSKSRSSSRRGGDFRNSDKSNNRGGNYNKGGRNSSKSKSSNKSSDFGFLDSSLTY